MKKKIFILFTYIIYVEIILQLISFTRYVYLKRQFNTRILENNKQNWFFGNSANSRYITDHNNLSAEFFPYTGYILSPLTTENIHISQNHIRTTSHNPLNYNGNTTNIYMFGGSTLFGVYANDSHTIPSLLASILNNESDSYMVSNYGQIGYNSGQELHYLISELQKGNIPDIVLFYDGANDVVSKMYYTYEPNDYIIFEDQITSNLGNILRFGRDINLTIPNNSIFDIQKISTLFGGLKNIKIVDYPYKLVSELQNQNISNTPAILHYANNSLESLPQDIVHTYAVNMQVIQKLAEAYKFQYFLFWQPTVATKKISPEEHTIVNNDNVKSQSDIYIKTTSLIRKMNMNHWHDLTNAFSEVSKPLYIDSVHISPEGNKIIAQQVADILIPYMK